MKRTAVCGVMGLLALSLQGSIFSGFSQSKALQFDTVSIRLGPTRLDASDPLIYPGGNYRDPFAELISMIAMAYDVKDPAITVVGLPEWAQRTAWTIAARSGPDYVAATEAENTENVKAMLRSMLADRFKLKIHSDVKQTKVLALHIKEGGAKLQAATASVPPQKEERVLLGLSDRRVTIVAKQGTLAGLVSVLTLYLPQPVVDKTGLKGFFDMDERWDATYREGDPVPSARLGPDGLAQLVSLLDQKLGLVLKPDMAPVPYWVIDHVEMPSEN